MQNSLVKCYFTITNVPKNVLNKRLRCYLIQNLKIELLGKNSHLNYLPNSFENEGLNVLKLLGETKSFGDGNVIGAKNANITIKADVPPELEDVEIVETN